MLSPGAGKKRSATAPGRKTEYSIHADLFVRTWEESPTLDVVYETLKAHSEKAGTPVMPKPIIVARAAEYRSAKVPLKKMPRVSERNIDVRSLTELVEKLRAGAPAPAAQALAPKAVPAKSASAPPGGLTREEVEDVVVEVLVRLGVVSQERAKARRS